MPLVIVVGELDEVNVAATKLAHVGIAGLNSFLGGGILCLKPFKWIAITIRSAITLRASGCDSQMPSSYEPPSRP